MCIYSLCCLFAAFFLLCDFEYLIGNDGFMGAGKKILIHEAIIFDFIAICTDSFLKLR